MTEQNSAKFGFSNRCLGLILLLLATSSVKSQEEEPEPEPERVCQPRPADIVFVIDGSRSVRPWHFKSTTDAVKDMVDQFQSIGPDSVQVGLIQYGSLVKQEFALGQYQTKEEVNEAIDSITFMAGGTMTGAALRYLVTRTFTKAEGARMRPDVAQIAVVITDGRAQDGRAVELWQRKVKEAGIEVFAIGVGRRIDDEDLLLMASEPKETHKLYVQNFDLIQNLNLLLRDQLCVEEINECEEDIHGCDHICRNTVGSYYCECRTGFVLEEDGRTCRYNDPCENSDCGHECEPTPSGGFRCTCPEGYVLNRDERTCSAPKPASPVDLAFSDITHASMRVTWQLDEPARASGVDYYVVTYQESDKSGGPRQMRVTDPEAVLEGLTPGTEYTVSVTSHKGEQMSGPLTGSETTLFLGETRVTLSNPKLTSLFATWDPAGGDLLSGYVILVQLIGENGSISEVRRQEVTSEVHEMTIGNLEPGQSYRVTVTPMHGKLTGGAGSDEGMTLSLRAPDVLVTDTTYKSAVVQWTGIGGAADYFTVQLFPSDSINGDEVSKVQNVSGDAHSTKFSGLEPATEYTAVVVGYVGEFSSPEGSAEGMTQTPQTPSVSVTDSGLTTMDVIWTTSGPTPDYFEVEYFPTDDYESAKSLETEDISLSMVDLTPGTKYTIEVIAVYEEDGKILSSKGLDTARTTYVPSPLVQITKTGVNTLDAEWSVDGLQPDSYKVEIYYVGGEKAAQNFTTTNSSMSFTNLFPNTRYVVRVRGVYQTESEVVGEVVSRPGTDQKKTKSPPTPAVQITRTGVATLDAKWSVDGLQPDTYSVEIFKVGDEENARSFETNSSAMSFTGLMPSTRYTVRVRGVYKTGDEVIGDIVSKPGFDKERTKSASVPEVEIIGSGLTTLDAIWTFDGADAESFIVTVRRPDGSEVKSFSADEHSATITGLDPATDYIVSVAARFQAGGQDFISEEGSADGSTKFLKAPVVRANPTSWTTGITEWTEIGVDATRYKITYFSDFTGPTEIETEGNQFNATLLGLQPATDYFVSVVGIVEEDGRVFESPQGSTTFGIGEAPGPNVEITSTGLTTAEVSWVASDSSELNQPSEYRVTYFPTSTPEDEETFETSETSADLSGLTQGTEYTVQVIGLYQDPYEGGSTFKSSPGKDTDTTKSLRAPKVTAAATSPTTAQVDWSSDIGYPAISWVISYRIKGSEEPPKTLDVVGDVTSYRLQSLVRDAEYEVSVLGIVEEDEKQYQSPPGTDDFIMSTYPAPIVTNVQTGLQNMEVTWNVTGKTPSQYVGRYYPTDELDNWKSFTTEFPCYKLTGLNQDTEYTVEITAIYDEGDVTVKTDPGSDSDRTKTLHAPDVTTTGSTLTTADIEWTGIGMPADLYLIEFTRVGSDDEPFNLRYAGYKMSTTLKRLQMGEEYNVVVKGVVVEDGVTYESPIGSDSFILGELVAPVVTITNTTTTTIDVVWETEDEADYFFIVIRGDRDESFPMFTVNGDVHEMKFDSLTPGMGYDIIVITKVIEDDVTNREISSPPGRTTGNTKPDPPQNLTILDEEPADIIVSFDPPQGGHEYYQAKCVPNGMNSDDVELFKIDDAESLKAVCADVKLGVGYRIYIRTIFNDEPSEWATLEVSKALGPPQNFDLTEPTTHTILATWEPPQYLETVNYYILSYVPEDRREPTTRIQVSGSSTQYLIEKLRPSTAYRGSIAAVTDLTTSSFVYDTATTLDDTVSISVLDTDFNTIGVKWPGSLVPGVTYMLSWTASPDFILDMPSGSAEFEPGVTTTVIRDLIPATIYDITIEYRYPSDVTAEAETSGTTLAPPPGPLSFTDVNETSYVVHWGKPGFSAEPIGYIVSYVGPDPGEIVAQPDGGDTLQLVFDSLKPGTTYNVTVIARYQNGIESEPVTGQVTTREFVGPITGGCSCSDYMRKQDQMQNTVEKLVGAIQVLTARIGDLEMKCTEPPPTLPLLLTDEKAESEGSGLTPLLSSTKDYYYELLEP